MSDKVEGKIQPKIISINELLNTKGITIPAYQRPYKWSSKNVHQLIDDIIVFKNKPAYRLGTVVYHSENGVLNIVDGQQRTLTFMLIALAIKAETDLYAEVKKQLKTIPNLEIAENLNFTNQITKRNLRDNYIEISQRIKDFDIDTALFFFQKCEVVKVVLSDISEAFQFFDSQNARGVDLAPHDLLKAFHLREMQGLVSEKEQTEIVSTWENTAQDDLKSIFAYHLFRIRNWSKGKSARKFSKNDVHVFKGISPNVSEPFPFAAMYRISHFYVDGYNKDNNRNIDQNQMAYPFQLDQVIINGKRFFEMIQHYSVVINNVQKNIRPQGTSASILKALSNYEGRNRTGDKYVYSLFKCALIYYIDKFGHTEIDRVIEKIFIWAYTVRLVHKNVQLATMDNYAIESPYIFKRINESLKPNDFLNIRINIIDSEIKGTKIKALIDIFKKLNYIHE